MVSPPSASAANRRVRGGEVVRRGAQHSSEVAQKSFSGIRGAEKGMSCGGGETRREG